MDKVIIAIIVLIVLIGIGVGTYFLLRNKQSSESPVSPPPQNLPPGWKNQDIVTLKNTFKVYIKNYQQKDISDDMMNCIVNNFLQNLMKKSKVIDAVDKIAEFLVNALNFNAYNVQTVEVYITYNYAALTAISQCIAQKDWDIVPDTIIKNVIPTLQKTFPDLKIQADPEKFKSNLRGIYTFAMFAYLTQVYIACKLLIKDESKFPQILKDFKANIATYGQQ